MIHIGISLFAAAKLFESFLGVPMISTIVVLSLFTVTYTALGGLKAVVMTENMQVCLLLGGAMLMTVLGLQGPAASAFTMLASFKAAVSARATQHAATGARRPAATSTSSPGWPLLLGYPILGIWYWCADQTHVQRVLGREEPEGRPERRALRRLSQDHARSSSWSFPA